MKKAVAVLCAGILLAQAGIAAAAAPKDPKSREDRRIEQLTRELDLSPDQQARVLTIMKASDEEVKGDLQKIRASRQEASRKIRDVLTPEQVQKFDAMQQQRGKKILKRKKQDPAGKGLKGQTKPF